jgi:hypothetical protein
MVTKTLAMIKGRKHEPYMGAWMARSVQSRPKQARQAKSKDKSMLIISLTSKGSFTKNSSWQAKQSIQYTTVCDVLQRLRTNLRRLWPELWRQKNWLLHQDNTPSHTSFFTSEFLTKDNMTVVPHPPYFSVSPLKIKLKGSNFNHVHQKKKFLFSLLKF